MQTLRCAKRESDAVSKTARLAAQLDLSLRLGRAKIDEGHRLPAELPNCRRRRNDEQ